MRDILQQAMQNSPVTGVAAALIENESISYACLGDFQDQSITLDTVWPVASLTKPVFAFAVLQLIQNGVLELDRPLQDYLPMPYLTDEPQLAVITARHALTHSTGFPNWRGATGLHTQFPAGSKFSYSSEALNYLQTVIEHLIGRSMADYLETDIFPVLGMSRTRLEAETPELLRPEIHFLLENLPASGALSLRTTIRGYARFMAAMLDAETAPFLVEMFTPQIAVGAQSNLHWGLGWGLQTPPDDLSFWHWGARGIPVTMNVAVGWPLEGKAAVIFTNHAEGLYFCREVMQALFPSKLFPAFDWLLPAKNWRPDGSVHH